MKKSIFLIAEDDRLIAVVEKFDDATLAVRHRYKTTSGMPQSQVLADILLHLFNHQTHHRGQAHACLSILTGGARQVVLKRDTQEARTAWRSTFRFTTLREFARDWA